MTIAETQTPNPLETVSEYWHSLSAPRHYDLRKHQPQAQQLQEKRSFSYMDLSIDTSFCASLPSTSAPSTASPSGSSHRSSFSTELSSDSNSSDNSISLASAASEMAPAHRSLSRTTSASTSNISAMTTTVTATALASSIQCLHSSASEQGKLLAQRSRTSLNRFLDSVLDNATSLAESNDAHESYSEGDDDHGNGMKTKDQLRDRKLKMKMSPPPKPPRLIMPSPRTQRPPAVRKPMFFVSDSDSEEEEEEEEEEEDTIESEYEDEEDDGPLMMVKKKITQPATVFQQPEEHEADGDSEASESEKEDVVDNDMTRMVRSSRLLHKPNNTHAPIHGRRQSLLSNLLQAEKLQSSSASTAAETISLYPARPSQHHHHQEAQQQRDLKRNDTSSQLLGPQSLNEDSSLKAHLLVRTKKVYKNLDELVKASASTTATTPHSLTTAIVASDIPTCELSSTTTPMASTTLSSWSRSRSQVQVQIQSLVVQSTSTAQRALLSASAALTDVLFRSSGK
ncbi:hypothetical protein BG011_004656 [Mortierella polycephala]|uniref:Uncharacterized protein n=1 Tax=Mortierella polycephala TaxID=41804 RepID=A0A9P6PXP3_9FUNG|nr:hypothetical protein BG011_004656 [Mortierella polycephala]